MCYVSWWLRQRRAVRLAARAEPGLLRIGSLSGEHGLSPDIIKGRSSAWTHLQSDVARDQVHGVMPAHALDING